jgi:hypothetical protein
VKKTATLLLLMMTMFALLAGGCHRGKTAANATAATTQTIAPAAGQPAVNGGDAVTQTVDVEDGRSVDDGGVLTNPETAKTPPAAKAPAKPAKKHR